MNVNVGNMGNIDTSGSATSLSQKGRWASALGGGALLTLAARRRSPLSIPLALGGVALVLRGLTGHRSFRAAYKAAAETQAKGGGTREQPVTSSDVGEANPAKAFNRNVRREREKDVVEEASEDSFPASDPPSFSPTAIS